MPVIRFLGLQRFMRIDRDAAGIEPAVRDELDFHFDMTVSGLVASGMSPDDARREAQRRFGDLERTRERLAAIDRSRLGHERRAAWWNAFAQDFRYAVRGLRLKPGFTLAVVATLGLGIGANTAMFGIVDRLLFRPPELMRDPATAHQVYVYETFKGDESVNGVGSFVRFADLSKWTTSFSSTAAYTESDIAVGVGDAARVRQIGIVSASFFSFFDAPPAIGRYFTEDEDRPPGGAAVAVLSYGMWQAQFAGRPDVVGSRLQIGPTVYTVIGVGAPHFVGLWADKPPAAYIPITSYAAGSFGARDRSWWTNYARFWMSMIVRRKPGVSIATANADLSQAFAKSYEVQRLNNNGMTTGTRPRAIAGSILEARGPEPSPVTKVATWIGGVSMIVLLIACANVANLLLARALRRRREIALRLALGVSRARLLSQLFTESVLLAVLGGAAGLVIAHWGSVVLRAGLLEKSEAAAGFRDARTVLFAAVAAIAVGLITGLAPAIQAQRAELTSDLKAGSREGAYGRSRLRVALLVFQAALSVVLLVGAGLFVRSLRNVHSVRLGYDVDPVLLVNIAMRGVQLDSAQSVELRERLMQTAKTIPGVETATLEYTLPFWSMTSKTPFVRGIDSVRRLGQFDMNSISGEYFATMGTRILRGRGISDHDTQRAPGAVVVSESMGKALWPGRDAIGQCMKLGADTMPCMYVVGIAEDIKDQSFTPARVFNYYLSAAQFNPRGGGLLLRVRGRGDRYVEVVRRRLQREMPGVAYITVLPFSDIIGSRTRSWHLGATMFVAFGVLALVLAAVGLYSVIAYNVVQRTHELGVRVALGAQAGDVVRLVVREGLGVIALGVVLGGGAALLAGRWVKPMLFEISPNDPGVFAVVAVTLVVVAIGASWLPASRASRVDPNVALRSD